MPTATNTPAITGIASPPETCREVGLSRTTLWRMVKAGTFPKPVKLSPRRIGWRRADLHAWVESRQEG